MLETLFWMSATVKVTGACSRRLLWSVLDLLATVVMSYILLPYAFPVLLYLQLCWGCCCCIVPWFILPSSISLVYPLQGQASDVDSLLYFLGISSFFYHTWNYYSWLTSHHSDLILFWPLVSSSMKIFTRKFPRSLVLHIQFPLQNNIHVV